jgi:hypothetical protein
MSAAPTLADFAGPWRRLPHVVAFFGAAWLVGAVGLTAAHVYFAPESEVTHSPAPSTAAPVKPDPASLFAPLPKKDDGVTHSSFVASLEGKSTTPWAMETDKEWRIIASERLPGVVREEAARTRASDLVSVPALLDGVKIWRDSHPQETSAHYWTAKIPVLDKEGYTIGGIEIREKAGEIKAILSSNTEDMHAATTIDGTQSWQGILFVSKASLPDPLRKWMRPKEEGDDAAAGAKSR